MNLVEELKWRGLLHDIMPGTDELMQKEKITAYCGFDPTSDSLHIGNLVPIILLKHLQNYGHSPIALIGGATGMVGDPSGKSAERNLLDIDTLRHNEACVKKQLQRFLNFDNSCINKAEIVNNYDWFKDYNFLDFIREVGKHITVNYMMAKDSVQKRLEGGMSFTEFSYQLIQGYDFYWLWKNKNVKVQAAGSDQWGNIVTGTELIRRMGGGEGFAFTNPLITKADGSKFGKSESGNIWLDEHKTTPYQFYQFWFNTTDVDAAKYIKIFTFLQQQEIDNLILNHNSDPGKRLLQKELANQVTILVHGKSNLEEALAITEKLFNTNSLESLQQLSQQEFLLLCNGLPVHQASKNIIGGQINILQILTESNIFPSKAEARKMIEANGLSINKEKCTEIAKVFAATDVLHDKYILVQKGKKNNFLLELI
jgi:tyrosyl-tRNA synthetase